MRILTLFCAALWIAVGGCTANSAKGSAGERAIAKVEQFRQKTKRLPSSLEEVGIPEAERGPVYYDRKSDDRYVIWYGTTLGESMTYDSKLRRWEPHN